MTREEAIKFLSNTKVYVNGKSKEIQEKLFSLGCQWQCEGKHILNADMPFLFVWDDMNICYSNDMEHFVESEFKEITVNDILNIVIDEPAYRPFKDANECFEEMKKHEPFGYIFNFDVGYHSVVYISEEGIYFFNGIFTNYEEVLNLGYRFTDGTPFGIKED